MKVYSGVNYSTVDLLLIRVILELKWQVLQSINT